MDHGSDVGGVLVGVNWSCLVLLSCVCIDLFGVCFVSWLVCLLCRCRIASHARIMRQRSVIPCIFSRFFFNSCLGIWLSCE